MRVVRLLVALAAIALPAAAAAQVALTADRIYLGATGCTLRTGAGTPTGGGSCEFFLSTTTGDVWQNVGGTWRIITTSPTVVTLTATSTITTPTLTASTSVSTPTITAAANLTLSPTGDLVLAPTGRDVLPGANYFTNLGGPLQKFLTIHAAELDLETLVAQEVISTIGGQIIVAPTTALTADLTTGATAITVKHNEPAAGDILWLEGGGQVEFISVIAATGGTAGAYTYTVNRNLDGSGPNAWVAGNAVVNLGVAGDGYLRLWAGTSSPDFGPNIMGFRRNSATYNDWSPRFALGNLSNAGYGHPTETYGLAAGNPSGAYIFLDDTNGLVMGGPGGTPGVRVHITPSGTATFTGDGGGVTNINGGTIQTDTITSDQIAANTITVGDLNATGFGDNVIKNGAFEPSVGKAVGDPSGIAGWSKDPASTSAAAVAGNCCGLLGPGTLYLNPGSGVLVASYLAFPVERGSGAATAVQYRVSGDVYSSVALPLGAFHLIVYEWTAAGITGVRRVLSSGATYPDVNMTSQTALGLSVPVPALWSSFEYLYTPPADVLFASLVIANVTASHAGPALLHFDNIEMQKQIGAGHIQANAITATHIAAGAITADKVTIGGEGAALNNDPGMTSITNWPGFNAAVVDLGAGGFAGRYAIRSTVALGGGAFTSKPAAVDPTKTYRVRGWVRAGPGSNGLLYLGVRLVDGAGSVIIGDGSDWFYCAFGATPPATFTEYSCPFGAGTARPIPSNARTFGPGVYLNNTGTAGYHEVQDLRIEELVPATLIQDGAITTVKVTAGAITAEKISANTITADQIAAGAITASELAAGAVTAASIDARSITADRLVLGTLTADEIAGGTITGDKIAATTITGANIAGTTITGNKIAGTTITGDKIAAATITADKIVADSITANEIAGTTLSAISADLGTITAGTITGVLIDGVTIRAGSGDEIVLDNSGMTVSSSSGTGPGTIRIGGSSIYADATSLSLNAGTTFAVGNFRSTGSMHSENAITADGNITADGHVEAGTCCYVRGGGLDISQPAVYFRSLALATGSNVQLDLANGGQFVRFSSSERYKENIQPLLVLDALAILRAPLIRFDFITPPAPGTGTLPSARATKNLIGFSAEGLAALSPDLVNVDALGRPDSVRDSAVLAYMIVAMRRLEQRIADLEKKLGGKE